MLPPFIIDQIRKREEQDRDKDRRPVVELPLHLPVRLPEAPSERVSDNDTERGVVIIDLLG